MKKFFAEFKAFISRGNVVDMAVGVIIGGAFSAIVTALTNHILMPIINWVLAAIVGKDGLAGAVTVLSPAYVDGALDLANSIYIDWGAFISAIINFLLIALVLFLIIKAINSVHNGVKKGQLQKSLAVLLLHHHCREKKIILQRQLLQRFSLFHASSYLRGILKLY